MLHLGGTPVFGSLLHLGTVVITFEGSMLGLSVVTRLLHLGPTIRSKTVLHLGPLLHLRPFLYYN